jgi:hypothetical protein
MDMKAANASTITAAAPAISHMRRRHRLSVSGVVIKPISISGGLPSHQQYAPKEETGAAERGSIVRIATFVRFGVEAAFVTVGR